MKDIGVANVILGIRIHKTPQDLVLTQSHYVVKILDKFKYLNFNIVLALIDASFVLHQKNLGESNS